MHFLGVYEFLIYSQHKFVKGQVLDTVNDNFNDAIVPVVSRSARFVGLDYDAYDNYIYYSDGKLKRVYNAQSHDDNEIERTSS